MNNENEEKGHNYNSFLPWKQSCAGTIKDELDPDPRLRQVYFADSDLRLAAEIAIVTGRPLLLRGEPGSGKSSFAPFVAKNLGWRYDEFNVTGRTEAKDLLWSFDALRRLRDAQAKVEDLDPRKYVTPEILWHAFDHAGASEFIRQNKGGIATPVDLEDGESVTGFVVLIDEIDKADPNVPNDLLEVIGNNTFKVDEIDLKVERKKPPEASSGSPAAINHGNLLIIITTNEERDLPPAFVRRCIIYNLREPEDRTALTGKWVEIARLHLEKSIADHPDGDTMVAKLAEKCFKLREKTIGQIRRKPSTAEFLDVLKTCLRLDIKPDSEIWNQVERSVLLKENF